MSATIARSAADERRSRADATDVILPRRGSCVIRLARRRTSPDSAPHWYQWAKTSFR